MPRLAVAVVSMLLAVIGAPVAAAQIGPTLPAPTEQPAPPPPPQRADEGSLSTRQAVLIFGSAALVLGAIAFLIVRDARKAAPVDERRGGGGQPGAAKSARERERAQRAKRQKAKAARQQRKRNRPG